MFLLCFDDFYYGTDCPSDVEIDIKANGQDGPLHLALDEPLSVAISLDPDDYVGKPADWWIYADTPEGIYSYVFPFPGWTQGDYRTWHGNPLELESMVVLSNVILDEGEYTFHFALDDNYNGIKDETWKDSVSVQIFDADFFVDGEIGCPAQPPQLFINDMPMEADGGDFLGESEGYDYDGTPLYFTIDGTYNYQTQWISTYIYIYYDPGHTDHVRTDLCEGVWDGDSFYDDDCVLVDDTHAGCVPIWFEMTLSDDESNSYIEIPTLDGADQQNICTIAAPTTTPRK